MINFFIKKGSVVKKNNEDFIEGEVIKEKNKKEDDL